MLDKVPYHNFIATDCNLAFAQIQLIQHYPKKTILLEEVIEIISLYGLMIKVVWGEYKVVIGCNQYTVHLGLFDYLGT